MVIVDFGDLLFQNYDNNRMLESKSFSIMTGIVKENYNEQHPGKVLVELFYGEKGKTVTEWIKVMQPYCGNEYGSYFVPEIGTEVVLGFVLGDVHKPVVLGCLWNEVDKVPPNVSNKENSVKYFKTKGGHEVVFDETKDKESIKITTNGKQTILLEDKEKKITIQDEKGENLICIDAGNGQVEIKGAKKIVLKAGDAEMLALDGSGKKASLKADNIEISANQALTLKGQNVKLEGNMASFKAQGSFKAESSAVLELKGAMVKIN